MVIVGAWEIQEAWGHGDDAIVNPGPGKEFLLVVTSGLAGAVVKISGAKRGTYLYGRGLAGRPGPLRSEEPYWVHVHVRVCCTCAVQMDRYRVLCITDGNDPTKQLRHYDARHPRQRLSL